MYCDTRVSPSTLVIGQATSNRLKKLRTGNSRFGRKGGYERTGRLLTTVIKPTLTSRPAHGCSIDVPVDRTLINDDPAANGVGNKLEFRLHIKTPLCGA